MTDCFVSSVKVLGIDSVQLSHPSGEIALRSLDNKKVVVVHETVGMTEPVYRLMVEAKIARNLSLLLSSRKIDCLAFPRDVM